MSQTINGPDFKAEDAHGSAYLNELAVLFDSRVLSGTIGIEGPPFAGKSTFAAKLAGRLGASLIPEHTDFDLHARDIALSAWPEDEAAATARQAYFYRVEGLRMEAAASALRHGPSVVMDRTALSVAVYSMTRAATNQNAAGLKDLEMIIADAGIRLTEQLYLLQVPTKVLLARAEDLASKGTPRAIEPFLLRPATLDLLTFYYRRIACRLQRCKVTMVTDCIENIVL